MPWASPKDLKRVRLSDAQEHLTPEAVESGSRLVPAGSIFIVVRGMILARDIPVARAEVPMAFNQDMKAIIPTQAVDGDFLLYALMTRKAHLARDIGTAAHGTKRIGTNELEALAIPLPPLPEQKAIASALAAVHRAIEASSEVIQTVRGLRSSVLGHLLGNGVADGGSVESRTVVETEIGPAPEDWEIVSLEDVCEFLQYGTSERGDYSIEGWPVLRIPNVIGGQINYEDLKYVAMVPTSASRVELASGDLLFVRTNGQRDYVGRCAVYDGVPSRAVFASYLIRARLDRSRADPHFVSLYANSPAGRSHLAGRASYATGGRFNLNTQVIRKVRMPLPALAEQEAIVRIVKTVDRKLNAELSRHAALQASFDSLLRDLMAGRRRVYLDHCVAIGELPGGSG